MSLDDKVREACHRIEELYHETGGHCEERRMSVFEYIGDRAILYKGRICPLLEHDGFEVVNAMRRADEQETMERNRLKSEIKAELAERKEE